MDDISYNQRLQVYDRAIKQYGKEKQCIVALEELSECQKEICKFLRGKGNLEHLAEEVADATICLEQVRIMFGLNGMVGSKMYEKVQRLYHRLTQDTISGDTAATEEPMELLCGSSPCTNLPIRKDLTK